MEIKVFKHNSNIKLKTLISFLLLIALSFSVVHEYFYTSFASDHCSIEAYIDDFSQIDALTNHDKSSDLCKIHCGYHTLFTSVIQSPIIYIIDRVKERYTYNSIRTAKHLLDAFRPPTA